MLLRLSLLACCALAPLAAAPSLAQGGPPPRREPLRLVVLGDSISDAINAEEADPRDLGLTRNRWASWATGYTKDWNSLLDRTNVNSHSQRIEAQFGEEGQKNWSPAQVGGDSGDLLKQAKKAVKKRADYVPILMGQNDVCGDDFDEIPTDDEFRANIRAGFDLLRAGLPPGATIYTLGIIDLYRLWQIGEELEVIGIECHEIWDVLSSELIPCATMLDPDNDEADRQFTRGRLIAFNGILADLVAEYGAADPQHYWQFSNATFETMFEDDHVSPIDCFHPSAEGQALIAEESWSAGPFATPAPAGGE
jgi:lysophospholipase L1-like esterase